MTALAALLLLAAAASASLSPLLAIGGAWAALIVGVMAGINAYRNSLERGMAPPDALDDFPDPALDRINDPDCYPAPPDVIVARVQKGRVIRVHKKETS